MSSSAVPITHGGRWLTVSGVSESQANDLLDASYQLYQHAAGNTIVLRTISYGLPAELHAHVQTIVPTTYFGVPHAQWQMPRIRSDSRAEAAAEEASRKPVKILSSRDESITPSLLRELCKTETYVPVAPAGQNVLAIVGMLGQHPNENDLTMFMNEYYSDGADATYRVEYVNGGLYNPNNPGLEATTNVQYAAAMTYPTTLIFYNHGRNVHHR